MANIQSRPYQEKARTNVFAEWLGGKDSTLVILPTGCGKTVLAGMIAAEALEAHGRRMLFLAHRGELITQAANTFQRMGMDVAIEKADQRAGGHAGFFGKKPDVVVGTVQTLQGRRLRSWDRHEFGLICTDEAHHARARTYRAIYDYFQGYWHLGITATPDRGDGQNLGAVYESVALEYSLKHAIGGCPPDDPGGWLVPLVTARCKVNVDLRKIKTTGGDLNQGDLEEAIGPYIEELADATKAEIGARQTVIFTPDVGSAEGVASALKQMGAAAEAVSGRMNDLERARTLRAFANKEFQVICCCDLLIEGWDCPSVSAVVVMRPTLQRSRYAQMIGRGTRPCPGDGKEDCLIVDFAWETTTGHELVTAVELFDDSNQDDEVQEIAQQLLFEGKEPNPMRAVERAEEIFRERQKFKIRLTGRKAAYTKFVYDPVGVAHFLGIPIKRSWDLGSGSPATAKQVEYLKAVGIDAEGMTKFGASKFIDEVRRRREQDLATPKQVQYMINLGVDPEQARTVEFARASEIINELKQGKRRA
ncbi:MAG: DEAD/DEAH box helicase [Isosphaeraceae bacterium]|nr:DEAD/DEAH box helicase [Isosphaeraceae bacterium]